MKKFNFNPDEIYDSETTEKKENPYKGEIVLNLPSYKERLLEAKTLNIGEDKKASPIDDGIKLIEFVEKHIVSVDLLYKKTDEKITTIEDLGYYKDGAELINTIGRTLMSGIVPNV